MQRKGEAHRRRAAHLALQRRRDALVALRAGETVWVTVRDADDGKIKRCKVEPMQGRADGKVLCFARRSLWAAQLFEKDGLKVWISRRSFRIDETHIFGRIVEQHARLAPGSASSRSP